MQDKLQEKKSFSFSDTVAVLSILAMVAKAAGFAEKMVIAHYFGTNDSADIYFAATGVILSIVFLVKEMVHPTLLPVLVRALKEKPVVSATLVKKFLLLSGLILAVLGITISLFSNQMTAIFVPGFSPDKKMQMVSVLRYLSPACVFMSLSMVTYTILNAYKKFMRAGIAETAYKFIALIGLFILIPSLGLKAIPAALFLAAMVSFVLMLTVIPHARWNSPEKQSGSGEFREVFRLMVPIAVGVIFSHVSGLVDNMLASTLPTGHLSYLGYSKKLIDAILLIGPVALVTVSYPHLASLSDQSREEYVTLFVKVLRVLIYMSIPGTVLIVILREPMVQLLFERGQFGFDSTDGTAKGLLIYALGLSIFAVESHLVYSFYAYSDTKTPVSVGIGCVILDIILAISLIKVLGYLGIALAFVVSKGIKILILGFLLNKRLQFMKNSHLFLFVTKTILAVIPAALLLLYLNQIEASPGLIMRGLVDLFLPATGFIVVFTAFSMLLRIQEMWQLQKMLCRRLGIKGRTKQ